MTREIKMTVASDYLYHEGLGHCQVTYFSKNDQGQRLVYCLQDQGERFGGVRLLRCTQDGEPSHEIDISKVRVVFERPKGDDRTEVAVNAWIDRHESEQRQKFPDSL